jgi:hypothetical protein
MIDTDKYEGHTPAPWGADLDDEGKRWVDAYDEEGDINLCRITNGNKADAQLMADALLLLEEVIRLREGRLDLINEVIRIINNKTGERVDADLHDYIIDRLVNE